ncbi:MAG TPA: lipoyl(octanoyl) transferase LipB [Candidatus Omnitrophota bacterium]|nr:lipoyl(octanoyl) transferase LipB [Candidatus Omnitrophota bacterium]HPN88135.1 lipoyl(octanoyl) transferase LipB [Candidatus Omnitrophota bacterium]
MEYQNHQIKCCIKDFGMMSYEEAYQLQKRHMEEAVSYQKNFVLLGEHPPILTLGRLTKKEHLLVSRDLLQQKGVAIKDVDRGGDITLHAPGQLVVYPIFCLEQLGKDLKKYLIQLEQVAIDLLNDFGIVANRLEGKTGVWVKEKKIASVGIGVKKWVTFHGIGINIQTDLDLFSFIKPCGLDVVMTSLAELKKDVFSMEEVKSKVITHLVRIFNLELK